MGINLKSFYDVFFVLIVTNYFYSRTVLEYKFEVLLLEYCGDVLN